MLSTLAREENVAACGKIQSEMIVSQPVPNGHFATLYSPEVLIIFLKKAMLPANMVILLELHYGLTIIIAELVHGMIIYTSTGVTALALYILI